MVVILPNKCVLKRRTKHVQSHNYISKITIANNAYSYVHAYAIKIKNTKRYGQIEFQI